MSSLGFWQLHGIQATLPDGVFQQLDGCVNLGRGHKSHCLSIEKLVLKLLPSGAAWSCIHVQLVKKVIVKVAFAACAGLCQGAWVAGLSLTRLPATRGSGQLSMLSCHQLHWLSKQSPTHLWVICSGACVPKATTVAVTVMLPH